MAAVLVIQVLPGPPHVAGELLWDNGIVPNGFNGRALSPPNFPEIRVADDIVAEEDTVIDSILVGVIEDDGWFDSRGVLEITIRHDSGNRPAGGDQGVFARLETEYLRVATGEEYFNRAGYEYAAESLNSPLLGPATYWIGVRNPGGSGSGTNYWMTSDGGAHGGTSLTGYFSLNEGNTWSPEGDRWHHAFVIGGVPPGVSPPIRFEVTEGVRRAGGLLSVRDSDDRRMVIEARRPNSVSRPSVEVVLEGETRVTEVERLRFVLEASTTIRRISQRIDLFNFVTNEWERVDVREATTNDSVVEIAITEDAGRFVNDADGMTRARVGFWDPGIPIAGWFAHVDQAVWFVSGS